MLATRPTLPVKWRAAALRESVLRRVLPCSRPVLLRSGRCQPRCRTAGRDPRSAAKQSPAGIAQQMPPGTFTWRSAVNAMRLSRNVSMAAFVSFQALLRREQAASTWQRCGAEQLQHEANADTHGCTWESKESRRRGCIASSVYGDGVLYCEPGGEGPAVLPAARGRRCAAVALAASNSSCRPVLAGGAGGTWPSFLSAVSSQMRKGLATGHRRRPEQTSPLTHRTQGEFVPSRGSGNTGHLLHACNLHVGCCGQSTDENAKHELQTGTATISAVLAPMQPLDVLEFGAQQAAVSRGRSQILHTGAPQAPGTTRDLIS